MTAETPETPETPELQVYPFLCIGCPLGCRLEVLEVDGDVVEVRGNSCKKGDTFARQERVDPRRSVTTTIAIDGAAWPRLPVKTVGEVPVARVADVCRALRGVHVKAPVQIGDVIVADVAGTGIAVVATRTMR